MRTGCADRSLTYSGKPDPIASLRMRSGSLGTRTGCADRSLTYLGEGRAPNFIPGHPNGPNLTLALNQRSAPGGKTDLTRPGQERRLRADSGHWRNRDRTDRFNPQRPL